MTCGSFVEDPSRHTAGTAAPCGSLTSLISVPLTNHRTLFSKAAESAYLAGPPADQASSSSSFGGGYDMEQAEHSPGVILRRGPQSEESTAVHCGHPLQKIRGSFEPCHCSTSCCLLSKFVSFDPIHRDFVLFCRLSCHESKFDVCRAESALFRIRNPNFGRNPKMRGHCHASALHCIGVDHYHSIIIS